MMRLGHGGKHRLAVNGHLGVLDDDVRPPSSVQNHPPTVGIEYVCKDAHATGILMVLANSGTRGGAHIRDAAGAKEMPDAQPTLGSRRSGPRLRTAPSGRPHSGAAEPRGAPSMPSSRTLPLDAKQPRLGCGCFDAEVITR
jgi:hypothetical protein